MSEQRRVAELSQRPRTMGQWVMGHGSNGSTNLDESRGSWVSTCDPLTRDPLTEVTIN